MSYEITTLIAIVLGPFFAVLVTLWHQERTQKRAGKESLFRTLMAYRKTNPPTVDWAGALNLIDVIYAEERNVVSLWHDLYALLQQPQLTQQQRDHKYLELLSEMAMVLGYKSLTQTDIDKFYVPPAHGALTNLSVGVQAEWLRVLRNTQALAVIPLQQAAPVEPQAPAAPTAADQAQAGQG